MYCVSAEVEFEICHATSEERQFCKTGGKLKERVVQYKEKSYLGTSEMIKDIDSQVMIKMNCFFHRECYADATNATNIKRAETEFEKSNSSARPEAVSPGTSRARVTRSSLDSYQRDKCFFCQDETESQPLINLRTFNRSNMIKEAIEKADNDTLRIRFNSFSDAHAGDVKYHLPCMINNVDRVLYGSKSEKAEDPNEIIRYAVEEELVSSVELGIRSGSIFDMKTICKACVTAIQERGGCEERSEKTLKIHIKKLLQDCYTIVLE